MAKYRVPFKAKVTIYVDVIADDKEEAIEKAQEEVYLTHLKDNRSVGVREKNMSVDYNDDYECVTSDVEIIDENDY